MRNVINYGYDIENNLTNFTDRLMIVRKESLPHGLRGFTYYKKEETTSERHNSGLYQMLGKLEQFSHYSNPLTVSELGAQYAKGRGASVKYSKMVTMCPSNTSEVQKITRYKKMRS